MMTRLEKMGLGTKDAGFVPVLQHSLSTPSHTGIRPQRDVPHENTSQRLPLKSREVAAELRGRNATMICVCGLEPCVCDGSDSSDSGGDEEAPDSDDSLHTDPGWEDASQAANVKPVPFLRPGQLRAQYRGLQVGPIAPGGGAVPVAPPRQTQSMSTIPMTAVGWIAQHSRTFHCILCARP